MKTIGKIAKEAGVGVETVRFYERKGLVEQPRKSSGFRTYREEDATRIRFIKRAQELGFTLNEVRELLALNDEPGTTCGDLRPKARAKLAQIEAKISDLRRMESALMALETCCALSEQVEVRSRIMDCFEGNC